MKYIYVCGPTVYSDVHIGNMRPIMTFDIHNRALTALGDEFFFIHNITDIDDKIIAKAKKENKSEIEISDKYETLYLELLKNANIVKPDSLPKVTDNIEGIISYIQNLIDKENAYEVNGNVYFSIKSISSYGALSNRSLETMKFEEQRNKKHPGDFTLWKNTKDGVKFNSPWGPGRPGWHTECSYFISKEANGHLDIHGGGIDLIFPHHENENIQNIATHGKKIAKEWRHVGHINFENEKMSKSLGNVILAKDFFNKEDPDILRYIFLTTSYSAPINLNKMLIDQAKNQIEKLSKIFIKTQLMNAERIDIKPMAKLLTSWNFSEFNKEMNLALKLFNKSPTKSNASSLYSLLLLIGFKFTNNILNDNDKELFEKWELARDEKDFIKADEIRSKLQNRNLI